MSASSSLTSPTANQTAVQTKENPVSVGDPKPHRRFRVIRGNWMPTVDRKNASGEAVAAYPLPSSLLDVPPNARWGNEDEELPAMLTRKAALQRAATLNRESIEVDGLHGYPTWFNVAEIVECQDTTILLVIDAEHAFEDRTTRFTVRVVEPTAAECEQLGDPAFVASVRGI